MNNESMYNADIGTKSALGHLVKNLHCAVDDVQLQKLLREVLQPEVDGPSRQQPQKGKRSSKDEHTQHIKQLVSLQPAIRPRPCQSGHSFGKSHRQDGKDSLHDR